MTNAQRIAALRGRNFGVLACAVRDYLNEVEPIMTQRKPFPLRPDPAVLFDTIDAITEGLDPELRRLIKGPRVKLAHLKPINVPKGKVKVLVPKGINVINAAGNEDLFVVCQMLPLRRRTTIKGCWWILKAFAAAMPEPKSGWAAIPLREVKLVHATR